MSSLLKSCKYWCCSIYFLFFQHSSRDIFLPFLSDKWKKRRKSGKINFHWNFHPVIHSNVAKTDFVLFFTSNLEIMRTNIRKWWIIFPTRVQSSVRIIKLNFFFRRFIVQVHMLCMLMNWWWYPLTQKIENCLKMDSRLSCESTCSNFLCFEFHKVIWMDKNFLHNFLTCHSLAFSELIEN